MDQQFMWISTCIRANLSLHLAFIRHTPAALTFKRDTQYVYSFQGNCYWASSRCCEAAEANMVLTMFLISCLVLALMAFSCLSWDLTATYLLQPAESYVSEKLPNRNAKESKKKSYYVLVRNAWLEAGFFNFMTYSLSFKLGYIWNIFIASMRLSAGVRHQSLWASRAYGNHVTQSCDYIYQVYMLFWSGRASLWPEDFRQELTWGTESDYLTWRRHTIWWSISKSCYLETCLAFHLCN